MNNITALSIIALAALIHASFQLGVSMVTLLSGQSAGKRVAGGLEEGDGENYLLN